METMVDRIEDTCNGGFVAGVVGRRGNLFDLIE